MPTLSMTLIRKLYAAISVVALSAAMQPSSVVASPENIASVHGSGERGGVILTVSAIVKSNGETSGQAMFHDRNTNSKLSIDVTSLRIYITDRTAIVTGEVTKATNEYALSYPPGAGVSFFVEDSGEGANDLPDEFSDPMKKLPLNQPDGNGGIILPESESGNLRVTGAET